MIDTLIETIEHKGYTIEIHIDDAFEDILDFEDFFSLIYCVHRKYKIGHDHTMSVDELIEYANEEKIHALPLYLYDHGNIALSTAPFSCPWDSGQVGFVFCTDNDIRDEYGKSSMHQVTEENIQKAYRLMESEVKRYNYYLSGQVYGFIIEDPEGEPFLDNSCWGFLGPHDESGLLEEAKMCVDAEIRYQKEQRQKELKAKYNRLKALIKNNVPLQIRQRIIETY